MSKQSTEKQAANVAANDAADRAEMSYDELKEQLAVVRSDLADLTSAMQDLGRARARKMTAGARDTGRRAVAAAGEGYDQAVDGVEHALSSVEDFTCERPATALGIAAAAGFVAALVLSRR